MSNKLVRDWEGGWVANTTGFVVDFGLQNEIWEGFERDPATREIWAPEEKKCAGQEGGGAIWWGGEDGAGRKRGDARERVAGAADPQDAT
jgi:hypothetical protein